MTLARVQPFNARSTDSGPLLSTDTFEIERVVGAHTQAFQVTADRLPPLVTGVGLDTANLLDYVQDGDVDQTAAMTRALATGMPIRMPYNKGTPYVFSQVFTLTDNTTIYCDDGKAVVNLSTTSNLFQATARSNINILNLAIDGQTHAGTIISMSGCTDCFLYNVDTRRPGSDGIRLLAGCVRCVVERGHSDTCGQHGLVVDGAATTLCTISRRRYTSNVGFGCIMSGGTFDNEFSFNRTMLNGLELLGVTYECARIRVIGNHAELCGDNGISITGSGCTLTGNVCRKNYHNGIAIYGSRNAASGNSCNSNGQRFLVDGLDFAGIHVQNGFGGAGYDNAVAGNTCCDDQATPTQAWGTHILLNTYLTWVTGTVTPVRTYKFNGNNVYVSTTAGTTGVTAPTHTSGSVSDGGVTWLWLFGLHTDGTQKGPTNNHIGNNAAFGNRIRDWRDESGNYNSYMDHFKSYNATPVNAVQGRGGEIVARYDAASYYVSMYVKGTGSTQDKTLWQPVQPRASGATSARVAGAAGLEGAQYWNSDTGRLEINAGSFLSAAWTDTLGKVDSNNNITAAGSTITDATQLLYCDNSIQTAAAGTGVKLPLVPHKNARMFVFNPSGGTPNVFPGSGAQSIDSLSAGTALNIAAGSKYEFVAVSATQWRSFKSA